MHGMLQPISSTFSRVAWDSLNLLRCASGTLASSSNGFSSLAQPISSTKQPPHKFGPVVVTPLSEGLQHEGGSIKGHFDRRLPLGSYEAFLKKDSSFAGSAPDAIDPWDPESDASKTFLAQLSGSPSSRDTFESNASGASQPEPAAGASFNVGEGWGGPAVEEKWGAETCEATPYIRGDPLEWFQHHTTSLAQISRARSEQSPLAEEKFMRQLLLEGTSRDLALMEYQAQRVSAEKRGELCTLQPVKQVLGSWMPALEESIANDMMQYQRSTVTSDGEVGALATARAQYGAYLLGFQPAELGKLTIEAVLMTVTMGETRRRSKTAARDGKSKATAVVLAIGQRVQDAASYYAINASVLKKQQDYQQKLKFDNKADRDAAAFMSSSVAGALSEGPSHAHITEAGSSPEELKVSPLLSQYNSKFEKAAARGRQIKFDLMKMREIAASIKQGGHQGLRRKTLEHLDLASDVQKWDIGVRVRVGAALLTQLLDTAKVYNPVSKAMEPAVTHGVEFEPLTRQTVGIIRLHERTVHALEDDEELRRGLVPKYMPMIIEPRPWDGTKTGGYLTLDEKVMKTRSSGSLWKSLRAADKEGQLVNLYDALTVIGNVPWRINKDVFHAMRQLWDSSEGGEMGLPSKSPQRLPVKVTSLCKATAGLTPHLRLVRSSLKGNSQLLVTAGPLTSGELFRHLVKVKAVKGTHINAASLRSEFKHKIEVAEQFLNEPCIYYPHQVDFRGRAYTLHPHLQHLGDDVCRGLLQFSEGKILGQRGLYWLKVQIANVYGNGKDKLSFDDRVKWTEEQMASIEDSATDPLGGQGWWKQGEKPWQLLATCTELYAAMSGDPETFLSHISVHQDGSCNGLQHYAALGRDLEGGASVNLVPSDQPQDVYKGVAVGVSAKVEEDAAAGNRVAQSLLATGPIGRGLVKQTVMTSVYGVTYIGAREQIKGKLQDRGVTQEEELNKMTAYLTPIVINKMGQVFTGARDIMKWLADCASIVASLDKPMQWRSPLGFPIEQPYRKDETTSVMTGLQSFTLATSDDDANAPVARKKQRSSFPPNYIHSLDGAHMMMTAMACREEGMSFAGVHDSYWTHACDVDRMNVLIREKFVELHSLPLMDYLVDDIQNYLTTEEKAMLVKNKTSFKEPPTLGKLDLELVKKSTYFFS